MNKIKKNEMSMMILSVGSRIEIALAAAYFMHKLVGYGQKNVNKCW